MSRWIEIKIQLILATYVVRLQPHIIIIIIIT